ncbi:MAG: rhomboid family intramembrane serine protease [Chloroflexi bacterium]|nr:rhomboid family intramembrane serine protease [Chloroflexota bacterium]
MLPAGDTTGLPRRRFPYVTVALLVLSFTVFAFEVSLGDAATAFIRAFGFIPRDLFSDTTGQALARAHTMVTSLFIHGSILHLAGNMVFLWVFGDNVEDALGHVTYLAFYLACGVLASLAHAAAVPASALPSIGASGAIAGVLAAYLLLYPGAIVRTVLFFGPFVSVTRVAAAVLILFWLIFQAFQALGTWSSGSFQTGGTAFFAHLGGFGAGALLVMAVQVARHRGLGCLVCVQARSPVFLNWMLLMAALLGFFSLGRFSIHVIEAMTGWDVRQVAALGAGALALFDGLHRLTGRNSLLGAGHGLARWLAIVQVVLALLVLLAILG